MSLRETTKHFICTGFDSTSLALEEYPSPCTGSPIFLKISHSDFEAVTVTLAMHKTRITIKIKNYFNSRVILNDGLI